MPDTSRRAFLKRTAAFVPLSMWVPTQAAPAPTPPTDLESYSVHEFERACWDGLRLLRRELRGRVYLDHEDALTRYRVGGAMALLAFQPRLEQSELCRAMRFFADEAKKARAIGFGVQPHPAHLNSFSVVTDDGVCLSAVTDYDIEEDMHRARFFVSFVGERMPDWALRARAGQAGAG